MYYLGIDLGGTNIAVGVVDEKYNIIKKGSVPTKAQRDPEEIVKDMAKLCSDLLAEANVPLSEVAYAGIAAPGTINPETGSVDYANNLPFLNFPIASILRKYLPVEKVYVENDANAAAYGESIAGAARGTKFAVMITLGTGLGGGIVIDGKVYSGFNYAGAELGHMVIEYKGKHCTCGRDGCWESYSSATGLIRMTREKLIETKDTVMWEMVGGSLDNISGKTAFTAMKQGDHAAAEVVDLYISYLACGVTNLINIFQPEVLCIGGGICREGDYLIKPLLEKVSKEQYTRNAQKQTVIKVAELGNDAGIIGAAALGQQ
jgi:Transcriptional regulator/sugar kinase